MKSPTWPIRRTPNCREDGADSEDQSLYNALEEFCMEHLELFRGILRARCTACDGFIPFYSNCTADWFRDLQTGSVQPAQLSLLLEFVLVVGMNHRDPKGESEWGNMVQCCRESLEDSLLGNTDCPADFYTLDNTLYEFLRMSPLEVFSDEHERLRQQGNTLWNRKVYKTTKEYEDLDNTCRDNLAEHMANVYVEFLDHRTDDLLDLQSYRDFLKTLPLYLQEKYQKNRASA